MRKFASIAMGVFEARHNHVEAKRCYGSKISKSGFIKVTIDLTEPMTMGDTLRYFSNGRMGRKSLPCDSEGFKATSRLYPHNWGVKGTTL
jgi:hypothetical protein